MVREVDLLLNTCLTVAKADHDVCFDGFSPNGEPLQPASLKQIEGEAPQNGVLDQQSEVAKDGGKVEAPPFHADKLDGSCPPEGSVSCPVLPPLNESKTSAPTEPTGKGYDRLFESMSVTTSDGQRAQAPETSAVLGSGEPALHHIAPPAEFTIGKGKYQPGEFNLEWIKSLYWPILPNVPLPPVLEETTQKERSTTPPETLDTMGSLISHPPFESHTTTEDEIEPQPSPGVAREPVMHGALTPVLSNDHTLLDHRFIVDGSSPEQGVQDHHPPVTNGMSPLILLG